MRLPKQRMADEKDGAAATPIETVELQSDLDQVGLAEILKGTLERDEQPEPQPADAEEQSEESEQPDEASVSAEGMRATIFPILKRLTRRLNQPPTK